MRFDILTIFPEVFAPYLETSLLGKAQEAGVLEVNTHDIREFATDKHKTVDDTPYGGGAGMVMKVEPIDLALNHVGFRAGSAKRRIIVLSARGEQFTQAKAQEYAQLDGLTLICGRYEGIDQRVADYLADEELSIGPYVLAGGEAAAMVVLEATSRLVPGVLGNPESLKEESFSLSPRTASASSTAARGTGRSASLVEYPQYTKPEEYKGWPVPDVLLSGDHGKIDQWREAQRQSKS